jgi:hypothetical protein
MEYRHTRKAAGIHWSSYLALTWQSLWLVALVASLLLASGAGRALSFAVGILLIVSWQYWRVARVRDAVLRRRLFVEPTQILIQEGDGHTSVVRRADAVRITRDEAGQVRILNGKGRPLLYFGADSFENESSLIRELSVWSPIQEIRHPHPWAPSGIVWSGLGAGALALMLTKELRLNVWGALALALVAICAVIDAWWRNAGRYRRRQAARPREPTAG